MSALPDSRSVPAEPALWATQGGGLAELVAGRYVWFELPTGYNHCYKLREEIPEQWGLAPANEAASREQDRINDPDGDVYSLDAGFRDF